MAAFLLNITTLKTAYDNYLTATVATAAAKAAIVSAGPIPAYPTIVNADADWNSVTSARIAWEINNDTLQATLATATTQQRSAEVACLSRFGVGANVTSVDGENGIVYNEWVHVQGNQGGILTYSHWIAVSDKSTYLIISTTLPTQAFPNV